MIGRAEFLGGGRGGRKRKKRRRSYGNVQEMLMKVKREGEKEGEEELFGRSKKIPRSPGVQEERKKKGKEKRGGR